MRIRTYAAVGVTLLALTACGSSGGASDTSSAAVPSETAADVAWAESVCQRADELDASVAAIASSVSIDPQAGDVLDQLQQQIVAAVDTVKGDVVDLAGAVADVPKGSDPALTAASEQLTADKAALEASIDALKTAATAFSEAEGVLGKVTAFGAVSTAAGQVGDSAKAFGTSLSNVSETGGAAAEAAFAAAPTCQARKAS
ncbi:hypothetical protein [Longivirga aurantiaca]|uniref:Uncharacterized protein n=1 Tax=Longivirga aurantiaca TaxID=1837743 RepID=A0ABW1T5M5_9ACTN